MLIFMHFSEKSNNLLKFLWMLSKLLLVW